jgi:hypothetical protein
MRVDQNGVDAGSPEHRGRKGPRQTTAYNGDIGAVHHRYSSASPRLHSIVEICGILQQIVVFSLIRAALT